MARKERPLTGKQQEALLAAEDTLYGDTKMVEGYGRSFRGLRNRGYIEGDVPHVYLTNVGKSEVQRLLDVRR